MGCFSAGTPKSKTKPNLNFKKKVKNTTMSQLYAGASSAKAEKIFAVFDKDSSGDLDMPEIVAMVNAMAMSDTTSLVAGQVEEMGAETLAEMIRVEFDEDGDGSVSKAEFVNKCCNQPGIMASMVMQSNIAGSSADGPSKNPLAFHPLLCAGLGARALRISMCSS